MTLLILTVTESFHHIPYLRCHATALCLKTKSPDIRLKPFSQKCSTCSNCSNNKLFEWKLHGIKKIPAPSFFTSNSALTGLIQLQQIPIANTCSGIIKQFYNPLTVSHWAFCLSFSNLANSRRSCNYKEQVSRKSHFRIGPSNKNRLICIEVSTPH